MAVNIVIESPYYKYKKNGEREIKAKIECSEITADSEIRIAFSELEQFASASSQKVLDFFFISSFVYGIDRFIERRTYSVDGWSREINATFPVYEVSLWNTVKLTLEKTLSFLTGDYWAVNFVKNELQIPNVSSLDIYKNNKFEQVSLFSGGLDSLIGAIDFLANESNIGKKLLLVSHIDSQMNGPKNDQKDIYDNLPAEYKARAIRVPPVGMTLIQPPPEMEKTFRSRSLLFLGIAVLVADFQKLPIVVPENGSVSLNYPLSASRRGSCSTRTTHPTFIMYVQQLLSKLSLTNSISNPYEYETKGEMVSNCGNQELLKSIVHLSNSCGKRGHIVNRRERDSTHCGVCMPCTYRKASLINIGDSTKYGDDFNKPFSGKKPFFLSKQGQDLNACFDFLGTSLTKDEIRGELMINGIKDFSKLDNYVNLVVRTRNELRALIQKTCIDAIRRKKAGL